jgi:hypothetical protein
MNGNRDNIDDPPGPGGKPVGSLEKNLVPKLR